MVHNIVVKYFISEKCVVEMPEAFAVLLLGEIH